ncbi:hypothetical protein VNI00_005586 [Paramarasmius palmivorus]|uniref:RING-type domain-containing protein n=1 Tax=Paramarasmius palmivorus TaxID=297713 RepID=A0AAW0DFD6_9AGAR
MTSLPSILDFPTNPDEIRELVTEFLASNQQPGALSYQRQREIISGLPRLQEKQIHDLGHQDSVCPVCFTSLLAIIAEEEMAIAMDSPAHPIEELGVTRLSQPWQCGHIFCRKDISRWILDGHDSCPTCRRRLVESRNEPEGPDEHPGDAYTPADFASILELLSNRTDRSTEDGSDTAHSQRDPFSFIFGMGPGRARSDDSRNEYSSMYS